MPEETNRGLGSVSAPTEQQQAQGSEQAVAVPIVHLLCLMKREKLIMLFKKEILE